MSENTGIEIKIEQLNKYFGKVKVLESLNLSIKSGEFVAIVGKSGCGKSTLLRIISGLDKPSDGVIKLDEKSSIKQNNDVRYLFQEARLLPWKNILDNVLIGSQNNKELAENALRAVGLQDKAKEWPYALSGGQKQRVALARALTSNPKLILLDEPLGALDALTRIEMQQLIEKIWLDKKFTVILVTHDVSEAVTLADRVVLIEKGKIEMNIDITLGRPRIKDSDFAHFEKRILNKVLNLSDDRKTEAEYAI
ncbi:MULTISPECIES: ATP-binding cassette domain-containing protein [unclassified Clostridium]|uniref:ATP-binding cassette domain-containing protein n=1 Tax=unclassified Clostridium TaxID=2614128 RepID=UPI000297E277|nr:MULTISPECIES: ATP-binding cassette domain-containing protein [unclassified Clostridium]EKQ58119.1 MAG: ABC-type nitrate/sulfonate/bicarbonate transport system, ATPase component [Clostridium sp. Maddingley MBC34-26]